jgi:hypothetical protein
MEPEQRTPLETGIAVTWLADSPVWGTYRNRDFAGGLSSVAKERPTATQAVEDEDSLYQQEEDW